MSDVGLRFDILLSRLNLYEEGSLRKRLGSFPATLARMDALTHRVRDLERQIDELPAMSPTRLANFNEELAGLARDLHMIAVEINNSEIDDLSAIRINVEQQWWLIAGLSGASLALVLAVSMIMLLRVVRARRRQEDELRLILEVASAPIFAIDRSGRVASWNRRVADLTGLSAEEAIGADFCSEIVRDVSRVRAKAMLDAALTGAQEDGEEIYLVGRENLGLPLLMSLTPRLQDGGAVQTVVAVCQDLSSHKEAQRQLIQSSKLVTLGEMATGVAHELNQPMNVIRMAVTNLIHRQKAGQLDEEYMMAKLARIERQIARATMIIEHMRIFGRRDEGLVTTIDLRDTVHGALDLVGQQLRLNNIEVALELEAEPTLCLGSRVLMEQVFLNILINARDAILETSEHRGGKVTIVVKGSGTGRITADVIDSGGGMSPEVRERIFEPFFSTKPPGKGTSLGLAICYGIILDFKGHMAVFPAPGGTRMHIEFPEAALSANNP
jgi:PAS domain S-box-containing protein